MLAPSGTANGSEEELKSSCDQDAIKREPGSSTGLPSQTEPSATVSLEALMQLQGSLGLPRSQGMLTHQMQTAIAAFQQANVNNYLLPQVYSQEMTHMQQQALMQLGAATAAQLDVIALAPFLGNLHAYAAAQAQLQQQQVVALPRVGSQPSSGFTGDASRLLGMPSGSLSVPQSQLMQMPGRIRDHRLLVDAAHAASTVVCNCSVDHQSPASDIHVSTTIDGCTHPLEHTEGHH